jgi:hypothetical protein
VSCLATCVCLPPSPSPGPCWCRAPQPARGMQATIRSREGRQWSSDHDRAPICAPGSIDFVGGGRIDTRWFDMSGARYFSEQERDLAIASSRKKITYVYSRSGRHWAGLNRTTAEELGIKGRAVRRQAIECQLARRRCWRVKGMEWMMGPAQSRFGSFEAWLGREKSLARHLSGCWGQASYGRTHCTVP